MNLSFQNKITILNVKILSNFACLISSDSDITTLNKDIILSHESFALIFMKIKISFDVEGKASSEAVGDELGNHP